jgi:hypothetical protein
VNTIIAAVLGWTNRVKPHRAFERHDLRAIHFLSSPIVKGRHHQ